MSRTYRKPLRVLERNEERYVKDSLCGQYRCQLRDYSTKIVRRRKPLDQYKADVANAEAEYQIKLRGVVYDEFGRPHRYVGGYLDFRIEYIYAPRVSKFYYDEISWTIEQEAEELRKEYRKFTRDGHWNETSRNRDFKKLTTAKLRDYKRKVCSNALKGIVDESFVNHRDGKQFIWDIW